MHQVWRERDHQLALEQRLAHQTQIEVLQIAQTSVYELAGAAGGARREVGSLDERDAVAATRGVQRDPGAGDAAADDEYVEVLMSEDLDCPACAGSRLAVSQRIG